MTSAIVKTQSAWRRRRDNNTGKRRDAQAPTTPRCQRAADEAGGTPRPRNHQSGYRVRRGHPPVTGLVVADRVVTPDPAPNTTLARHQRYAAAFLDDAAYLDDVAPAPNACTGHLLTRTASPGGGRIDVRHRSGPT
jgi:hypothetical protein